MLLAAILISAAGAGAEPARNMLVIDPKANQPASCPATSRYEVSRHGKTPKAQRLNDLPDADMYAAVYRRVGQCEVPIIVKYGVAGR